MPLTTQDLYHWFDLLELSGPRADWHNPGAPNELSEGGGAVGAVTGSAPDTGTAAFIDGPGKYFFRFGGGGSIHPFFQTVLFWAYKNTAGEQYLIDTSSNDGGYAAWVDDTDTLNVDVWDENGILRSRVSWPFTPQQWHLIAIKLDGELKVSVDGGGWIVSPNATWAVGSGLFVYGASNDSGNRRNLHNGRLGTLAVYNRLFSATEVFDFFNSGKGLRYRNVDELLLDATGLNFWYEMTESGVQTPRADSHGLSPDLELSSTFVGSSSSAPDGRTATFIQTPQIGIYSLDPADLHPWGQDTLVLWAMRESEGTGTSTLLDTATTSPGGGYRVRIFENGVLSYQAFDVSHAVNGEIQIPGISFNVWHMIAISWRASNNSIYMSVDAQPWQTASLSQFPDAGTEPFTLGYQNDGFLSLYGRLSVFASYGRLLTVPELEDFYYRGYGLRYDAVALIRLRPDNCQHTHPVQSAVYVYENIVGANSIQHAHVISDPDTLVLITVTADNLAHGHQVPSADIVLGQQVLPASLSHNHLVPSAVAVLGLHVQPNNAKSVHAVQSATYTTLTTVSIDSAVHAHSVQDPLHSIDLEESVESTLHGHRIIDPDSHIRGSVNPGNAKHAHSVQSPFHSLDLEQSVDFTFHNHAISDPDYSYAVTANINNLTHGHTVESVDITIQTDPITSNGLLYWYELLEESGTRVDEHNKEGELIESPTFGSIGFLFAAQDGNICAVIDANGEGFSKGNAGACQPFGQTVICWAYRPSGGNYWLLDNTSVPPIDGGYEVKVESNGNLIASVMSSGGGVASQVIIPGFTFSQWHMIALYYQQSEQRLYMSLDGGAFVAAGNTGLSQSSGRPFSYGMRSNQTASWLNGRLSILAGYDRYLTEAEVIQLYNNGNGLRYINITLNLVPNDVEHSHSVTSPFVVLGSQVAANYIQHVHTIQSPTSLVKVTAQPTGILHGHFISSPITTSGAEVQANNILHNHTISSPAALLTNFVTSESSGHVHQIASPSVRTDTFLSVNNIQHLHSVLEPSFALSGEATPEFIQHVHQILAPLTVLSGTAITNPLRHGHQITEPSYSLTGFEPADSLRHAHQIQSPGFSLSGQVAAEDISHTHAISQPSLMTDVFVQVTYLRHIHQLSEPDVGVGGFPNNISHGHFVSSPIISLAAEVVANSGRHVHHIADPIAVRSHFNLVDPASHGHSISQPTFHLVGELSLDNLRHIHQAQSVATVLSGEVQADSSQHSHTVQIASWRLGDTVTVDNISHRHLVIQPAWLLSALVAEPLVHGHRISSANSYFPNEFAREIEGFILVGSTICSTEP